MKTRLLTIIFLAVVSALPLLLSGCDRAHAAAPPYQRQPPTSRDCTVQFRRDLLGTARDLPVSPTTGSINGAETCVRGKLMAVTDEWIILNSTALIASKPVEKEFWIPRDAVLLIEIAPK